MWIETDDGKLFLKAIESFTQERERETAIEFLWRYSDISMTHTIEEVGDLFDQWKAEQA